MTTTRTAQGRVTIHPRGFGFLRLAPATEAEPRSAFIPPPLLGPFLEDDHASGTLVQQPDGRWAVTALSLVTRGRELLFGEVVPAGEAGGLQLRPDPAVASGPWPLEPGSLSLKAGDAVVARVDPALQRAVAERRLEEKEDRALERLVVRHSLRSRFLPEVWDQAKAMASQPHPLGHRRDLRQVPTVTVDGPTTRVIDDAVSVLPATSDGALRLLVSIADPAEFVLPGSALDEEARARGTNVYLHGRVLPMLPDPLAADWLSLVPGEDRPCLTVELRLDPEGQVTSTDVYESLIRSRARLSYDEVAAFLDREEVAPALEPVRELLPWLRAASARLEVARARRGGLSQERDDVYLIVDSQTGLLEKVELSKPTSAHAMIERFMVAANEAIARWLAERGVPSVFLTHPWPEPQRVAELAETARHFGFQAGLGPTVSPLALSAFDHQITGTRSEPALRSLMLRLLGASRYGVAPGPHFGLAAPSYLHFTSPLRRYADLAVHRTLKAYLRGERGLPPDDARVAALCEHLNARRRAASRAEDDRQGELLAQMFSRLVGQTFPGRVIRVKPFGLIVQLDQTQAEGTLPAESLPGGPYKPDPRETALVGPGRSFQLGSPLTVRVASVDTGLGRIEFGLA